MFHALRQDITVRDARESEESVHHVSAWEVHSRLMHCGIKYSRVGVARGPPKKNLQYS